MQSTKACTWARQQGYDHHEKVKGRIRDILVDTLGLLLAVVVHTANEYESETAMRVLGRIRGKKPRLGVIFADQGYVGTPAGLI